METNVQYNEDWGVLANSKFQFIKNGRLLDLRWSTREREAFVKAFTIFCALDAAFVALAIFYWDGEVFWYVGVITLILVTVTLGVGIPTGAVTYHVRIDPEDNHFTSFVRNGAGKAIRERKYEIGTVIGFTSHYLPQFGYRMRVRMKSGEEVDIIDSPSIRVVIEAHDLIRPHFEHLAAAPLEMFSDTEEKVTLNEEPLCMIDSSPVIGFIYICPHCRARFCTSCVEKMLTAEPRCIKCGAEVTKPAICNN